MREKDLHVVGNPSARVRGEGADTETIGRSESVLQQGSEEPWAEGARRAARRGQSAMGHALNAAGWFWIGYVASLVLIVLLVCK